ncbi:MAG: cytochrome c peroxidase [Flavobacteriales bacterium]
MRKILLPGLLIALTFLALSCKRDTADPPPPVSHSSGTPVDLAGPWYFPQMTVPANNPTTEEGIQLGRRLYYDPSLSTGGPMEGRSCSSCHSQELGFTVPNTPANFHNVLPHVNLGWSSNFLWNGKVQGSLEDIMRFEVEEFFDVDVGVLQQHPEYPQLFQTALGSSTITQDAVGKALAQWFRSMISSNSRFDQYVRYEISLTPSEINGMMLYLTETGDCFHCHGMPLLTDNGFHNIGLDSVFTGNDQGRFLVTGNAADLGAFKAPTLRNIAQTGPYMHDGRFTTLEEVIEHYNSGVKHSASLDPIMTKPGKETGLNLSPQQKADLVAFLHTFSDQTFLTDTALASPF